MFVCVCLLFEFLDGWAWTPGHCVVRLPFFKVNNSLGWSNSEVRERHEEDCQVIMPFSNNVLLLTIDAVICDGRAGSMPSRVLFFHWCFHFIYIFIRVDGWCGVLHLWWVKHWFYFQTYLGKLQILAHRSVFPETATFCALLCIFLTLIIFIFTYA